jgi:hypothetical protein
MWCRWQHCLFRKQWALKLIEKPLRLWFFLNCGQCQWVRVSDLQLRLRRHNLSLDNPVINLEQFQRFMDVIRKLGDRVQKEHNQFLRDSQRIEDRTNTADNGPTGTAKLAGNVDFESLVGSANGATVKADSVIESWDDDVWGSIFTSGPEVNEFVNVCHSFSKKKIGAKPVNFADCHTATTSGSVFTCLAEVCSIPATGRKTSCLSVFPYPGFLVDLTFEAIFRQSRFPHATVTTTRLRRLC